jgi:formylglycine-generating enzyme required for sulfatase activity
MLAVPAGPFTMGADSGGEEDEHPAHVVTLVAFWLDRTEVTNAQWDECVASGTCRPKSPSVRAQHPDFNGPDQPVSGISWDDARGYCAWRGKRLPREAEFEKAVRDTDDRRFAWGNDPPTHEKTVFSTGHPEDVGTHPAGRGPYGHDDLAGNVWEWLQDERRHARNVHGDHGRARRAASTAQAGIHGEQSDPDRMRALHPRGRLQLRPARAARDQSRASSGALSNSDARAAMREG